MNQPEKRELLLRYLNNQKNLGYISDEEILQSSILEFERGELIQLARQLQKDGYIELIEQLNSKFDCQITREGIRHCE